jgi:hypothetical protein
MRCRNGGPGSVPRGLGGTISVNIASGSERFLGQADSRKFPKPEMVERLLIVL